MRQKVLRWLGLTSRLQFEREESRHQAQWVTEDGVADARRSPSRGGPSFLGSAEMEGKQALQGRTLFGLEAR